MYKIKCRPLKILKSTLTCFSLLLSSVIFSQNIGVNTANPIDIFHVDSKGNNPLQGTPSSDQQSDDFIVTKKGNVGIGTINPTAKLQIESNPDTNPLQIEGLTDGKFLSNNILVIDNQNIVKKASALESYSSPSPTIFTLNLIQYDFLQNTNPGGVNTIPMTLTTNTIEGLTYDETTSTIRFPKGTYQFVFIYNAKHKDCNLSSYFMEFPLGNGKTKVYNTSPHKINTSDEHGGSMNYATSIPEGKTWRIQLGRGESGFCEGKGMTLMDRQTQLLIYKLKN